MRIPVKSTKNELDKELFAHTSPVYFEPQGQRVFRSDVATELLRDVEASKQTIIKLGKFTDDAERVRILKVYQDAIDDLRKRLSSAAGR